MLYDLAAVDMNSDDILDLAVVGNFSTYGANLNLYCLAADGSMELKDQIHLSGSIATVPICLISADMDNDGLDDLVVFKNDFYNGCTEIDIFLNQGNFHFSRVLQVVPLPWASQSNIDKTDMTAADVTGDGLPDLIVAYLPRNQLCCGFVRIYPNIGGGFLSSLSYGYNLGSGTGPFRVAAAQMDNVTGLDLVVTNDDANELTIFFNDGHGAFSYQDYITSGGTDALTIADFDQDGDNDIALCHHDHYISGHIGSVSILLNRTISPELPAPDLDGDSDVDGSDLALFADAFGSVFDGDNYNPNADFDNNNVVNEKDLTVFAVDFGRTDHLLLRSKSGGVR